MAWQRRSSAAHFELSYRLGTGGVPGEQRFESSLAAQAPQPAGSDAAGGAGSCEDPRKPRRHGPYYQSSIAWQGKSSTRFLRPEQVELMRRKVVNYNRLRELVKKWMGLEIERERAERQKEKRAGGDWPQPVGELSGGLAQVVVRLLEEAKQRERRLRQLQRWLESVSRRTAGALRAAARTGE
jgi:hypothetical protein